MVLEDIRLLWLFKAFLGDLLLPKYEEKFVVLGIELYISKHIEFGAIFKEKVMLSGMQRIMGNCHDIVD